MKPKDPFMMLFALSEILSNAIRLSTEEVPAKLLVPFIYKKKVPIFPPWNNTPSELSPMP